MENNSIPINTKFKDIRILRNTAVSKRYIESAFSVTPVSDIGFSLKMYDKYGKHFFAVPLLQFLMQKDNYGENKIIPDIKLSIKPTVFNNSFFLMLKSYFKYTSTDKVGGGDDFLTLIYSLMRNNVVSEEYSDVTKLIEESGIFIGNDIENPEDLVNLLNNGTREQQEAFISYITGKKQFTEDIIKNISGNDIFNYILNLSKSEQTELLRMYKSSELIYTTESIRSLVKIVNNISTEKKNVKNIETAKITKKLNEIFNETEQIKFMSYLVKKQKVIKNILNNLTNIGLAEYFSAEQQKDMYKYIQTSTVFKTNINNAEQLVNVLKNSTREERESFMDYMTENKHFTSNIISAIMHSGLADYFQRIVDTQQNNVRNLIYNLKLHLQNVMGYSRYSKVGMSFRRPIGLLNSLNEKERNKYYKENPFGDVSLYFDNNFYADHSDNYRHNIHNNALESRNYHTNYRSNYKNPNDTLIVYSQKNNDRNSNISYDNLEQQIKENTAQIKTLFENFKGIKTDDYVLKSNYDSKKITDEIINKIQREISLERLRRGL
jgi:hypothetical protein